MYYIWFDVNGNPEDARYGNGAGPSTHQIRFDTGQLYLEVVNGETTTYGPITETNSGSNEWIDDTNNIQATITNNGQSLQIIFPLSLIYDPSTLEISAMASPWTTSALDNTGTDNGASDGWIIISDTTLEGSYEETDVTDESLSWPTDLSNSTQMPNFNIEKLKIELFLEDQTEDGNGIDDNGTDEGGFGIEIWLIIIVIIVIIIVIVVAMMRRKK
jgi:hypothetical protein